MPIVSSCYAIASDKSGEKIDSFFCKLPIDVATLQHWPQQRVRDLRIVRGTTGLDQAHGNRVILAQARRKNTPGTAGADNYEVIYHPLDIRTEQSK